MVVAKLVDTDRAHGLNYIAVRLDIRQYITPALLYTTYYFI